VFPAQLIVSSGGVAIRTTINFEGFEYVDAGGTESGATINSGGKLTLSSGGVASGVLVAAVGWEVVSSGGTDVGALISGTALTPAPALVLHAAQSVAPGGTAIDATIGSGGFQATGGTTSGTTIGSGGSESVDGIDVGATIDDGGFQLIGEEGIASGTIINPGGAQLVEAVGATVSAFASGTASHFAVETLSGGVASATTLSGAARLVVLTGANGWGFVSGGLADGTIVDSTGNALATSATNGGLFVSSGGTASGTIINSGGLEVVFSGGTDSSSVVNSGGVLVVSAAGVASDTTLAGGTEEVYGSAGDTTVDSGGYAQVLSAGTISGATISGGMLELDAGASAGSGTIAFAGGGTLKLDATGAYDFPVAGFAVPDAFDLSAVAFASATKSYTGDTSSGTLTVSDGTDSVSLQLVGDYTSASFDLGQERGGGSGTVVTIGSNSAVYSNVNFTLPIGFDSLILEGVATSGTGNIDASGDTLYAVNPNVAATLTGNSHNDTFVVYNSADVVIGQAGSTDTVYTAANFTLPTNVDTLFLEGNASHGAGNNDAVDTLYGNFGVASTLVAGSGADTLWASGTAGTILTGGAAPIPSRSRTSWGTTR